MEERAILTDNEKLALRMAGDTTSRIMTMDGKTADDVIHERAVTKHNEMVDEYQAQLDERYKKIDNIAKEIADNVEAIEIMPIGNYLLARQLEENPFQRIVKQGNIITDIGGAPIQFKNTDNGEIEEEEQFIKVLVVQEVGPDCRYIQPGDVIFTTKPSLVPVPFYKQKLQYLCETRVMAVVNEGLKERFKKAKESYDK